MSKEYCKITSTGQAMDMPNPVSLTIANATDTQKELVAQLDNWLEKQYTDEPSYDPETEYLVCHWEQQGNKAIQVWEVKEIEQE